jgi:hypothetical protein
MLIFKEIFQQYVLIAFNSHFNQGDIKQQGDNGLELYKNGQN